MKLTRINLTEEIVLPLEPGVTGEIKLYRNGETITLNIENLQTSTDNVGSVKVALIPFQHIPLGRVIGQATAKMSIPDAYRVWIEGRSLFITRGTAAILPWGANVPIRGQVMYRASQT